MLLPDIDDELLDELLLPDEEDTPLLLLLRVVLVELIEVPELLREEDDLPEELTPDDERLLEPERVVPTEEPLRLPDVVPDDLIEELRPEVADSRDERVDDSRRLEDVLRPLLAPDER